MTDYEEINALCEKLGQAHYDKDANAIVECYAPDALIYNLAPPLSSKGMDREETDAWLETWQGPVIVNGENIEIAVSGDMAMVTALNRMCGTKTDGQAEDIWFRNTMCLRKIKGDWLIVHDHSSTPFYMDGSLMAAVDLAPDSSTA